MLALLLALACSPDGATSTDPLDDDPEVDDTGDASWSDLDHGAWSGGDLGAPEVPCQGDVVVSQPDDLDALLESGCTSISGDLVLTDLDGVTQLSLPGLRSLDGSLLVAGNPDLQSIDLPALVVVSGAITLQGTGADQQNPELHSVWMPVLQGVGGGFSTGVVTSIHTLDLASLWFVGGDVLVDLAEHVETMDLGGLEEVGGDLAVWGKDLEDLDLDLLSSVRDLDLRLDGSRVSLASLRQARDIVVSSGELSMASLEEAASITSGDEAVPLYALNLPVLERVEGDIDLVLKMDRASLPSLRLVGGDLRLDAWRQTDAAGTTTEAVLSWLGLRQLVYVEGDLHVTGELVGEGLVDLESLLMVGGDTVFQGARALDLERLRMTGGHLHVAYTGLTELRLPDLRDAGGDIVVDQNPALSALEAGHLARVDGDFVVTDNPALSNCDAWAIAEQASQRSGIGGEILIEGNLPDGC